MGRRALAGRGARLRRLGAGGPPSATGGEASPACAPPGRLDTARAAHLPVAYRAPGGTDGEGHAIRRDLHRGRGALCLPSQLAADERPARWSGPPRVVLGVGFGRSASGRDRGTPAAERKEHLAMSVTTYQTCHWPTATGSGTAMRLTLGFASGPRPRRSPHRTTAMPTSGTTAMQPTTSARTSCSSPTWSTEGSRPCPMRSSPPATSSRAPVVASTSLRTTSSGSRTTSPATTRRWATALRGKKRDDRRPLPSGVGVGARGLLNRVGPPAPGG